MQQRHTFPLCLVLHILEGSFSPFGASPLARAFGSSFRTVGLPLRCTKGPRHEYQGNWTTASCLTGSPLPLTPNAWHSENMFGDTEILRLFHIVIKSMNHIILCWQRQFLLWFIFSSSHRVINVYGISTYCRICALRTYGFYRHCC